MTQTEFISALSNVVSSYSWQYVGNQFVGRALNGVDRGKFYNPVTAVARTLRVTNQPNTAAGTKRAASELGLTSALASAIMSPSNRGHAQIVRGKILDVLPV